ncbi:MAG: MMPL family transporter [Desulfobulbaceae bacterium]|nr:MMPL family transporter [Desulfobulbaceae bacterium]
MQFANKMIGFSLDKPKAVTALIAIMTVVLGALIIRVHVDTDPENMLSETEFVRIFHDQTKKEFTLHDVVVLGVVNETDENGVFNPETLKKINTISRFAATLSDPKHPQRQVISRDIIAPDNVDNIVQAGLGQVRFEWLMKKAPETREEALKIRDNALNNPLLKGTLVSEDGKALAIYLPITEKDFAHRVSKELKSKIDEIGAGDDKFYITGLPVAEDTFGKEMFIQMAISAPLAMLMIFLLMLVFFRNIQLIISPLIVAVVTIISTMGLLIGTGNTLHIMSSMIPIFIMPIAVVDSVHILSEFFDEYRKTKNRRKTIEHVMEQLFMPMLFTSLTSSAGFASLALTPIPPVQAFGIFVAIGIMLAWLLTIIFIPAYIMMMKEENLKNFGSSEHVDPANDRSIINRHLRWIGRTSSGRPWLVIGFNLAVMAIGLAGISMIEVNDNPIKWFKKSHDIRVADQVLNDHFGGTYEAYLVLSGKDQEMTPPEAGEWLSKELGEKLIESPVINQVVLSEITKAVNTSKTGIELADKLSRSWEAKLDTLATDDDIGYDRWSTALDSLDRLRNQKQIFKRPDLLNYISGLQQHLVRQGDVGKSNSVADVVKKVHQELFEGDPGRFIIPDTVNGVAQTLISYQNSHKPDDLWHLVTPDYTKANLWLQLRSGDNKDMERVVEDVDNYFAQNPPPLELQHDWAGLTYINVVWQDKMVNGMLKSFLSSFAVVFIMMTLLFRSPVWGLLAMIPLTFTIGIIYGVIGLIGKDYDMPVAVLSSLTLGLAVDFAIHFLQRSRMAMQKFGDWSKTVQEIFEEPARALARNTIVISVGFTPLLFAPLVPYQTVGVFLASIMLYSGIATMWMLPALLTVLQGWIFKTNKQNS